MDSNTGLFAWIRKTSFTKFFLTWLASIFLFALIYWIISPFSALIVSGQMLKFTALGLLNGIYGSFLIATILGLSIISHAGLSTAILYIQLLMSIMLLLILADKIIQKYVHPHYHAAHSQYKKINSLMLTMSVFRNHIDKIKHEYATGKRKNITISEIEAAIDGLYVAFLDIESIFSSKNMHRHKLKSIQYLMLTENIEDSLDKLSGFLSFLEKHKLEWKDKSTEFWIRYILDTADNITMNLENSGIKTPKVLIAVENIRDYTQQIEKKL